MDLTTDERLAARLYRPSREPRPLVVYLHGGGFVLGDLDSHDSTCRRLAEIADVAVLAVDYRLAPESPGPAAMHDAVAAVEWTRRHPELVGADGPAVALAGDSAGAAIALLAAVELRDRSMPTAALLLAYPNADLMLTSPSITAKGKGWGLDADDLAWFVEQWAPDPARRTDPALSPIHADLTDLPPTIIATAEHDPLRDEGTALAGRLSASGVEVDHQDFRGLVHGFLGMWAVSHSADAAGRELFTRFGRRRRREG